MKSRKNLSFSRFSLSTISSLIIASIVLMAVLAATLCFIKLYESSVEQNAVTSSEQSVVQARNMMQDYTDDCTELMRIIRGNLAISESSKTEFMQNLLMIRTDLVAVTLYDDQGSLKSCYAGKQRMKGQIRKNLSVHPAEEGIHFSKPHVESLLQDYYPWVVTMYGQGVDSDGARVQIALDFSFSGIANYIDEVGIGQHGYCFIMDQEGNIIYHPQQQLIYSGLKGENAVALKNYKDGTFRMDNVLYTLRTLNESEWRIVGVSYADEMITEKVHHMLRLTVILIILVLILVFFCCMLFTKIVSNPAQNLVQAMGEFEEDPKNFRFQPVSGTVEIKSLSDSFGHMVVQIRDLMEYVRKEEISLRKTELNALQAQINPHFLYNTLDSIAWMCEEERNKEAVIMVNTLAKLFRISISRGHELITLENEIQHAESYLKIQKYRYRNQFQYQFQVEEACLPYYCNKITLQPIIENAIYHGLDMIEEGKIDIWIRSEGDDILMSVADNGVGMEPELCREILYREAGDQAGIGIKNVHDRIRIYFGEKYGLTINSRLDEGTCVTIRIPKMKERPVDEK